MTRWISVLMAFGLLIACGDAPLDGASSGVAAADSIGQPSGADSGWPDASQALDSVDASAQDLDTGLQAGAGADGAGVDAASCPVCEDVPQLGSRTRYPIVLAHGMAGFDDFGPIEYWVGVEAHLRAAGFAVYAAVVDPLNGSDVRGSQLAGYIDRVLDCTCAEKVNVIAHSQGGIDSRVVVNALGYGDRVASVTTIASPHRGSPLADIGLGLVPGELDPIVDLLGWMLSEIYTDPLEQTDVRASLLWLSSAHLAQFELDHPTDASVDWISYAGRAGLTANGEPECEGAALPNPQLKTPLTAPLLATWTVIGGLDGNDNDGLVPVESAKWGEFRGCLPADHVQEIGMFVGVVPQFDHLAFYESHAELLVDRGH